MTRASRSKAQSEAEPKTWLDRSFDIYDRYQSALTEISRLEGNEAWLREELWLRHGHVGLYGDDGEHQCSRCGLDFKRDSLERIARGLADAAARDDKGKSAPNTDDSDAAHKAGQQ